MAFRPCARALRVTKRVCGIGPSTASTSRSTPSTIDSTRSTSPPKSAWPGVSTMLMRVPPYSMAQFLGEDGDARSRSMFVGIHDALAIRSWAAKVPDWFKQAVDQRGLAVVDVRDDGDVADRAIHGWLGRSACRRQARPAGPRCPRKGAQGSRFARWPPLFYGRRPRLPD